MRCCRQAYRVHGAAPPPPAGNPAVPKSACREGHAASSRASPAPTMRGSTPVTVGVVRLLKTNLQRRQPPFCDEDPMGIYQKILAGKAHRLNAPRTAGLCFLN